MPTERSRRRSARTTMTDVARAAGVSQSTVSFVINDRRDVVVAEETRARVLQVAADLNYQPNRTAQSLRLNQSFLVGVVTRGIVTGPYAGRIVFGIQKAVQAAGQLCVVLETTGDAAEVDTAVTGFLAQGVTAIIYADIMPRPVPMSRAPGQPRSVFVNCFPDDREVPGPVILADEYGGGRRAAETAFEEGHTEVAFLGGTLGEYACVERHRGFVDAARAAGIDPRTLFQTNGNYEISSGYDTALEAFRRGRPTALVCGNDRMAVGAVLALHTLGLEVPRDVSVIGFDDQPDMADEFRPKLTTVGLPHYEMGHRAGQLLLASDAPPTGGITVPCPLIVRDSLGPRPAARPGPGVQAAV